MLVCLILIMEENTNMNENNDKRLEYLEEHCKMLEKENKKLKAENEEMKLEVWESKKFANMPHTQLNQAIKKVRQSERLYNEALAEMEEKKKELDMHLEELKKMKDVYGNLFDEIQNELAEGIR